MPDLNALVIFAKVVESQSFSEAARRLQMPLSTVSRRIADLEDALGVRLLERSTRRLRLTDIGVEVLQQAERSAEIGDAVESIVSNQISEVRGVLRVSVPPSLSDTLFAPIMTAFQAAYPKVRIHVMVTPRLVDHIEEGVDIVFRVGPLKDSSLIATPVLRFRHQLVASPDYLKGREAPKHPKELLKHRLLAFSYWTPENSWTFYRGQNQETISFEPHLAMNDYTGIASALASGGGIGELPPIIAPCLMKDGSLVEVMPDWRFRTVDLSMVHLSKRHMAKPVRLFRAFAAQMAPTLLGDLPV